MHCPHPFSHIKYVNKCSWAKDAFSAKFWHASLSRTHHFKRNLKNINPGKKRNQTHKSDQLANKTLVKWSKRSWSSTWNILIFVFFVPLPPPPVPYAPLSFGGGGANNMNPALSWGNKRKKSAISDLFCFAPPQCFYTPNYKLYVTLFCFGPTRVEVWWWIFVRNAVKCGEKKIIFTAYFLHLFAVNAVNRGELFFFTAFSVFLQKRIVPTRVRSSDLLHVFSCLLHCPNCHLLPWHFSWI